MKFSKIFLGCLVSADEKNAPPHQSLQRIADWQSELGYNLYTVSGSSGYLLQLTLEALQFLHDCKLLDELPVLSIQFKY